MALLYIAVSCVAVASVWHFWLGRLLWSMADEEGSERQRQRQRQTETARQKEIYTFRS